MIKKSCLTLFIVLVFQSCTVVKEYEKEKINDVDMKQLSRCIERLRLVPMVESREEVVDAIND
jgi:hypothetical protein